MRRAIYAKARVGVEWVSDFHKDACRQQNDLSYCADQVNGFYDEG